MDIEEVRAVAAALLGRVEAGQLADRIRLRFNSRMRTRAGTCTYRRIRRDHVPREFHIDLNPHLVVRRHPEALLPTLAHELAHAVVRARFGGGASAHGRQWQDVIRRMGFPDERCHDLNVDGLERRRGPASRWRCRRCTSIVRLGPIQTRRERRRPGTYVCRCGGALEPRPRPVPQTLF